MIRAYIKLAFEGWKAFPALLSFVVLSASITFFAANLSYSYAAVPASGEKQSNTFTTVAVSDIPYNFDQTTLLSYFETKGVPVGAILFLSEKDGVYYIGWHGTDKADRWFPPKSGRFLSDLEDDPIKNETLHPIYVNETAFRKADHDTIRINDHPYTVTGVGFIVPWNLLHVVSSETTVQSLISAEPDGSDFDCRILLADDYLREGFQSKLILIRLDQMNQNRMHQVTESLQNEFPALLFHAPREYPFSKTVSYYFNGFVGVGLIPIIFTFVGFHAIYTLWLERKRHSLYILFLNGMSIQRIKRYLTAEYALILIVADLFSQLIQLVLAPFLKNINGAKIPSFTVSCLLILIVFSVGMMTNAGAVARLMKNRQY